MEAVQLYRRRGRRISLTALIDVVFILLMFFMLTSTFTRYKAVEFKSPVASDAPSAQQPQRLILTVDGLLRLQNGDLVEPERLAGSQAVAADRPMVLLPKADASVQTIVSSLERLKGLEFTVTLGRALPASSQD